MSLLKRIVENHEKISPKTLKMLITGNKVQVIKFPDNWKEKHKENYLEILRINEIKRRVKKCNLLT